MIEEEYSSSQTRLNGGYAAEAGKLARVNQATRQQWPGMKINIFLNLIHIVKYLQVNKFERWMLLSKNQAGLLVMRIV